MDNVFNRKLFKRKDAARDKLRSMGGIMASSEPLIQEAMRTVANAPQPQVDMQGIMAAQQRRGPMPAQPLPQIVPGQAPGMPAMAQPQMPAMPQMQQPAPQQPAPQPQAQPQGGMNPMQAQQGQPMRMQQGGRPMDRMMGGVPREYMGAAMGDIPQVDVRQRAGSVVARPEAGQTVNMEDITPDQAIQLTSAAMSGRFPVNLNPFNAENAGSQEAADLLNSRVQSIGATMQNPEMTSEEKSREIIAALGGDTGTDDIQGELSRLSSQTYGKEIDRDTKIDAMNRAITGFAIAAGTSPRATKNIANGMLAGLQAMKSTEEGRVANEQALRLAAMRGRGSSGTSTYNRLYETAVEKIMTRPDEFGIFVDEDDPDALNAASNQITTLADRIARAQMGGGGQGPSTSQPMTDIVTVTTQEDYDALEPGTPYIDSETGARSVKRG